MKTIIITLLLALSLPIVSQSYVLKASYLAVTDGNEFKESYVDINMYLDGDAQRLVVDSKVRQIIDYDILRQYVDEGNYTVYECTATDSNYKYIGVKFLFSNIDRAVIVSITYNNLAYSYLCERQRR